MKTVIFSTLSWLICIGWLVTFITGCSSQTATPLPTVPLRSATLSPSETSAKIHTATLSITSTQALPTPTKTLTPIPTLTDTQREENVRELLKTNAGCKLPCWWGIIPWQTSWAEAESFFKYLGFQTSSETLEDGSVFHGFGGTEFEDEHLYNSFGIYERNGNIDAIYIQGNEWSNKSGFHKLWEKYDPKQVLSGYGQPSRIWLSSTFNDIGAPGIEAYRLWLFYDHLGFVVKYDAYNAIIDGKNYHICPRMEGEAISEIRMLLQSPDNPEPLDQIDENTE